MKKNLFIFLFLFFYNCDLVFVENISDTTVKTNAPLEGSHLLVGTINFSWENLEDADQYNLQIAIPNFTEATQILTDTIVTKTSYSQYLDAGSYAWRIKGTNAEYETLYIDHDFFIEYDLSSEEIVLLSPIENSVLIAGNIEFSWEKLDITETYDLQIENTDTGVNIIDTTISETVFNQELSSGKYRLKLKAENELTNTGYYTTDFSIQEDLTLNTISLITPSNNESLSFGDIIFSWEGIQGVKEYQLQIENTNTNEIFVDVLLTNTTFTQELESGSYIWRVKGKNELTATEFIQQTLIIN